MLCVCYATLHLQDTWILNGGIKNYWLHHQIEQFSIRKCQSFNVPYIYFISPSN